MFRPSLYRFFIIIVFSLALNACGSVEVKMDLTEVTKGDTVYLVKSLEIDKLGIGHMLVSGFKERGYSAVLVNSIILEDGSAYYDGKHAGNPDVDPQSYVPGAIPALFSVMLMNNSDSRNSAERTAPVSVALSGDDLNDKRVISVVYTYTYYWDVIHYTTTNITLDMSDVGKQTHIGQIIRKGDNPYGVEGNVDRLLDRLFEQGAVVGRKI